MASGIFTQSDPTGSPPTLSNHCAGFFSTHLSGVASNMDNGAGTTGHVFTVPNDGMKRVYINWVGVPGVGTEEPSLLPNRWAVNWNVTSGNSLVKLAGVHICHEDASGNAIETIASYTPGAGAAQTTGIHSHSFANVNPTSWKAGDKVVYVISFVQPFGFSSVNITVKFDRSCTYVKATQDWRGVTLGRGWADRKREGVL